MGSFLSGLLGTNSQVGVATQNPYQAIQPWQQQAQQLSGQLQTEAAGGGPNPAQLQYLQNAQQIAQQQAALNAQNRALNPGLAARQSSQAGVQAGQQAAGGAAAQQAQQQLAAQGQLANLTAQQQQALNQAGGVNAAIAGQNQQAASAIAGGLLSGAGGVGAANGLFGQGAQTAQLGGNLFGADGGMVPQMTQNGPSSETGRYLSTLGYAKGGQVKNLKSGGGVPGKARVAGDSLKNDTVSAMLSPGEIVVPRTHAGDPEKAKKFVAAVLAHQHLGKKAA